MNTNPMDFFSSFSNLATMKPEQWAAQSAGYARSFVTELEKQAERWAEYGASQHGEAQRLYRTFQTQAFTLTKSLIDTTEKAFGKVG